MKNVFEKLRFHDGLVWMVGLINGGNMEIKLCFQNLPAYSGEKSDFTQIRTSAMQIYRN